MSMIKRIIYKIIPIIGNLYQNKLSFPIIYYHDIVKDEGFSLQKTNYKTFKKQMVYLAENNYKTFLLKEIKDIIDLKSNHKSILITFDDGYRSNYELAFPLMKDLGLKFNIFINTKMIEENNPDYMTLDMVREMYNSKIVDFGSHTHSHINAKNTSNEELIEEIVTCNQKISNWLGYETEDFCYPFGFYSNKTNKLLSEYYKRIYTSDCKPVEKIGSTFIRGRVGISTDDTIMDFKNKIDGKYNIMYYYYKVKNRIREID